MDARRNWKRTEFVSGSDGVASRPHAEKSCPTCRVESRPGTGGGGNRLMTTAGGHLGSRIGSATNPLMKISTPDGATFCREDAKRPALFHGEHGGREVGDASRQSRPDSNLNFLSGPPVIWQVRSEGCGRRVTGIQESALGGNTSLTERRASSRLKPRERGFAAG